MFRMIKTDFHTFPKLEDRTLNIIIKGLTPDITKEELKNKGYDAIFSLSKKAENYQATRWPIIISGEQSNLQQKGNILIGSQGGTIQE